MSDTFKTPEQVERDMIYNPIDPSRLAKNIMIKRAADNMIAASTFKTNDSRPFFPNISTTCSYIYTYTKDPISEAILRSCGDQGKEVCGDCGEFQSECLCYPRLDPDLSKKPAKDITPFFSRQDYDRYMKILFCIVSAITLALISIWIVYGLIKFAHEN